MPFKSAHDFHRVLLVVPVKYWQSSIRSTSQARFASASLMRACASLGLMESLRLLPTTTAILWGLTFSPVGLARSPVTVLLLAPPVLQGSTLRQPTGSASSIAQRG